MKRGYKVAVVGVTGAVGKMMLRVLEERNFPVGDLLPLASERSEGRTVKFRGEKLEVKRLASSSLKGIEIALFSAGKKVSLEFAPPASRGGTVVVDNSSAFRMERNVPLVVPEVNPHSLKNHRGIISNPNCSTIQLVVALNPIHRVARIKRVVVSTYQSVSGTGREAIEELKEEVLKWQRGEKLTPRVYPHPIAFNLFPHIGDFDKEGLSEEELKMVRETKKIMEDESIKVTATCVRVPVFVAHSEAVNIETERKIEVAEVKALLSRSPGVKLLDEPEKNLYPMPLLAQGKDEVFVGRIRKDPSLERGIDMWVVADNLRKGAALNAVQIAEILIRENLL